MRYENGTTVEIAPGSGGGHNWHPMAFSPLTGLVYIPGSVNSRMYHSTADYAPVKGKQLAGVDMNDFAAGAAPAGAKITNKGTFVKAWDPVAQKERWRSSRRSGVRACWPRAGQSSVRARQRRESWSPTPRTTGERLWDSTLVAGIATPIYYELDGKQYVAAIAGRGGNAPQATVGIALDGAAEMPVAAPPAPLKGALNNYRSVPYPEHLIVPMREDLTRHGEKKLSKIRLKMWTA